MMAAFVSPEGIEAVTGIALVILTFLTLMVLRGYANDTKIIAIESTKQTSHSVTQTENSQRPFLTLILHEGRAGIVGGWKIENQGAGPALNIRYTIPEGAAQVWRTLTSLPVGGLQAYNVDIDAALHQGLTIEYDSLSGVRYRTVVTGTMNAPLTTFNRAA